MAEIEIHPWGQLPIPVPYDYHRCGVLFMKPDGRALLYVNDELEHVGGFCQNPENMKIYAWDVAAAYEANGPDSAWNRLDDGSYITAITTADEIQGTVRPWRKAPPRG